MSNLVRNEARKALVSDGGTSKAVGGALVGSAFGGGVLWVAAGLIPFVSFPMLLIIAMLAGVLLYVKN